MNNKTLQPAEQQAPPNYVLIDGALWGSDLRKAKQKNKNHRSLYRGATGKELDSDAPYLFRVETSSEFEKWVKAQDPVKRRVMWLHSSATLEELHKHLRCFLRIKTEKGTFTHFRFYDPLVLNCVIPHLTEEQKCDFFREINYTVATTDDRRIFHLTENDTYHPSRQLMWNFTDKQMKNIEDSSRTAQSPTRE
jgi:hypothetical protein